MNNLSRVGIDLAKNIFQLHGVNRTETSTWRHRLKGENWVKVLLHKALGTINTREKFEAKRLKLAQSE